MANSNKIQKKNWMDIMYQMDEKWLASSCMPQLGLRFIFRYYVTIIYLVLIRVLNWYKVDKLAYVVVLGWYWYKDDID